MTQNSMSELIGYTDDYYRRIEEERAPITFQLLCRIKKHFNWNIDYILYGVENGRNKPFSYILSGFLYEDKAAQRFIITFIDVLIEYLTDDIQLKKQWRRHLIFALIVQINGITNSSGSNGMLISLRMSHGYTVEHMANVLLISKRAYRDLENGNTSPDIELLDRIYEKFGVNPDFFISGNIADFSEVYKMLECLEGYIKKQS